MTVSYGLCCRYNNVTRHLHDHLLSMGDKVPIITSKSFLFSRRVVMGASIVIQYFGNVQNVGQNFSAACSPQENDD